MRARNFENDRYKIIKGAEVLSVWEWQQLGRTGSGRKGRPEGVFRSVMKTPINSLRNDSFRINFTLVIMWQPV